MKILVFEYITGGGMRQEAIPATLAAEGRQMLTALMDDFLMVPGVELLVLQDDRLPLPCNAPQFKTVRILADTDFEAAWQAGINTCDAIWPIAPETDGILERLCRDVESTGKALLTSPAAAVRLAASKLNTASRLLAHGLPAIPTRPVTDMNQSLPFVIKPDDGVGCEGIRIIRDAAGFQIPAKSENWIAQPLLKGEALSLSALYAHGEARLLSVNRQLIKQTGEGFSLKGCQVNAYPDTEGRWQSLAGQVAQAFPELWGYAGIDLILSPEGPVILEINPRLTTSYAGLAAATGENPASMVLDLWKTQRLPSLRSTLGQPVEILLKKHHEH